jgi:tetratricopeptide (TPR) repeat protein
MTDQQPQATQTKARTPRVRSTPQRGRADVVGEAEELARAGRAKEAISVLDVAIAAAPDRADLWRAKARVWRQFGDVDNARSALDMALKRFRSEPGLWLDKAELQVFEGNLSEAEKTFSRATKIAPGNPEGWLGKGRSLLHEGKAKQALACAERVIGLDDRSAAGYALRGDSQVQLERWDEAFASFAEAAARDRGRFDASSWAARGDRFRDNGQLELALRAYERAIRQDRQNPEGWYGKGTILRARGNVEDALEAFERASEIDPSFIPGLLDAGELYAKRDQLDRALEFFERAKTERPNDPRPWIAIGGVHERRRKHEEARTAYEQATRIDPEDAETWNSLGIVLARLDRLDEALRTYRRAIEVRPSYGWPQYNLTFVLLRQQRFDEALESIDKAIALEPNNGDFWVGKLLVLNTWDRVDETAVDRALAAAEFNDGLRISIAAYLAENDRLDPAREILRGIDAAEIEDQEMRLGLAENQLLVGDSRPALELLESIDPAQLVGSMPAVWAFLRLLANRLVGTPPLSESLLRDYLDKLGARIDLKEKRSSGWSYLSIEWSFKGVRRLLLRSELTLADRFVLTTLIDVAEAKVRRGELSFFTSRVPA